MSDIKNANPASSDLTFTSINSLPTSSTWLAGAESGLYDNTSNLYLDVRLSGKIVVGTTPTINTQIRIYLVAEVKDGTWPDASVFDGTDSTETVTSAGVRDGFAKLAAVLAVDATTSNREYYFDVGSVAAFFGGFMPRKFVVFVTHNTGVNLNAAAGTVSASPIYQTV